MLRRPRFKPHFHVEVVEGEGVFLLSETDQRGLQGRLYELVAPRLDGRPVESVCKELAGTASPAQVFYTLKKLEQYGYLCESEDSLSAEEAALWTLQGIDPSAAARRLREAKLTVGGLGIDVDPLRSLLESLHVPLGEGGDLEVVVTDHYLRNELQSYNESALRNGRPWLLVKPIGVQVWIGPLFRPGKTACWECLAQRIRSNHPIVGYLDTVRGDRGLPVIDRGRTEATLSVAWGLAANTVAAWIARGGELPMLEGKIQTIDLLTWKTQSHALLKQPSCPACGDNEQPSEGRAQPLSLESCKKTYTEGGSHRALSPQETVDKYGHHVSPICGAVPMLERTTPSSDQVMHVYVSGNNIARGPRSLLDLKVDLRSSSCGKGANDLQAKASALCEGIERYCAIFRGCEPRRKARFDDLGEAAVHPNACMLFSDRQYQTRGGPQARKSIYGHVPRPFDPQCEIEWTPVWSLTRNSVRYLPTAFCYFYYPHDCRLDFCVACSNGNAAGNTREEAILQGFFELVERDSVGLWWYNRTRMPGVDLDSFEEPYLERVRAFWEERGRELWVLDLTSDLEIPTFAALARRTEGKAEQIMLGFGTHLDPKNALLRAVTELNQMLAPVMHSAPDGPPGNITDKLTVEWLQTATVADHPYLTPGESVRSFSSYRRNWTDDLKDDVLICKALVEEMGLEMLVLDQTRPEIGMPVVKVIVPGLRHFWARFAPGRLYEVPVKLGWLREPLGEEEMNPIPMFL